jgi:hypothetical protein
LEAKFVVGFLWFMATRFLWNALLGSAVALRFPPIDADALGTAATGAEGRGQRVMRRLRDLVCVLDVRAASRDVLSSLIFYVFAVSVISESSNAFHFFSLTL